MTGMLTPGYLNQSQECFTPKGPLDWLVWLLRNTFGGGSLGPLGRSALRSSHIVWTLATPKLCMHFSIQWRILGLTTGLVLTLLMNSDCRRWVNLQIPTATSAACRKTSYACSTIYWKCLHHAKGECICYLDASFCVEEKKRCSTRPLNLVRVPPNERGLETELGERLRDKACSSLVIVT